jgi:uncharacterized membrane protein
VHVFVTSVRSFQQKQNIVSGREELKDLTGVDDKESCFELVESIRHHVILACLCFLFLQLCLVSRQRVLLSMFHFLLQIVIIFQVLIPRNRVLSVMS